MLKYIKDEDEYLKTLEKNDVPNDFNNLNIKASNYVNYNTHGRIDINDIPGQVKYVTCLIIDLINEENEKLSQIGNLKSQNIEGWSESYATPEEIKSDYADKKYSILREYLWDIIGKDGNPLLFGGVR